MLHVRMIYLHERFKNDHIGPRANGWVTIAITWGASPKRIHQQQPQQKHQIQLGGWISQDLDTWFRQPWWS